MDRDNAMSSAGTGVNFAISKAMTEEKYKTVDGLIRMCSSNVEYYRNDKSFVGTKMQQNFEKLQDFLGKSVPVIREIEAFAHLYDYDEKTPGNGYRSFVHIFESAVKYSQKHCHYVTENRASLLFRKSLYQKEIEVCAQLIESLFLICSDLIVMHKNSENGNLYSKEWSHDNLITRGAKVINQTCFYGRAVGFQFDESLRSILKFLTVTMACFSEAYFTSGFKFMRTTNYFLKHPSYFMDPEMCARRIINVSHNADVRFCKSFWALGESKLMHALPRLVGYQVDVNRVFKIPPEPLQIHSKKLNKMIDIPVPSSHIGKEPVSCRLLCARRRRGMVGEKLAGSSLPEPSKYLIIHTHGGGWIATSSKSHEFYLREWASRLDCPILSIDYHLAPKAPFPRGLEDVFYVYCWILKNCELLGTTAENIVCCGDSAGANLNTACVIKCIEMGIPTVKGIFDAYGAFLVNFAQTPARYLVVQDPLIPFGFAMRIFKTYGTSAPAIDSGDDDRESEEIIGDIQDDKDVPTLLSPESSKSLEAIWQKVKSSEEPDWHSNLNSIQETSSEEPVSPLVYRSDSIVEPNFTGATGYEDDDALEMKIDEKNEERVEAADFVDDFVKKYEVNESTVESNFASTTGCEDDDSLEMKIDEKKEAADFVDDFVKKYEVNESTAESVATVTGRPRLNSRTMSEENIVVDVGIDALSVEGIQSAMTSIKNAVTGPAEPETCDPKHIDTLKRNFAFSERRDRGSDGIPKAPEDEFVFSVPRNHLMSPYIAPDDILRQFPKVNILTAITDPCIDDCVEFAKKLRALDVDVQLDIVGALNHGFLNFAHISKECHDASMLCLKRIATLLGMEDSELTNK